MVIRIFLIFEKRFFISNDPLTKALIVEAAKNSLTENSPLLVSIS